MTDKPMDLEGVERVETALGCAHSPAYLDSHGYAHTAEILRAVPKLCRLARLGLAVEGQGGLHTDCKTGREFAELQAKCRELEMRAITAESNGLAGPLGYAVSQIAKERDESKARAEAAESARVVIVKEIEQVRGDWARADLLRREAETALTNYRELSAADQKVIDKLRAENAGLRERIEGLRAYIGQTSKGCKHGWARIQLADALAADDTKAKGASSDTLTDEQREKLQAFKADLQSRAAHPHFNILQARKAMRAKPGSQWTWGTGRLPMRFTNGRGFEMRAPSTGWRPVEAYQYESGMDALDWRPYEPRCEKCGRELPGEPGHAETK